MVGFAAAPGPKFKFTHANQNMGYCAFASIRTGKYSNGQKNKTCRGTLVCGVRTCFFQVRLACLSVSYATHIKTSVMRMAVRVFENKLCVCYKKVWHRCNKSALINLKLTIQVCSHQAKPSKRTAAKGQGSWPVELICEPVNPYMALGFCFHRAMKSASVCSVS